MSYQNHYPDLGRDVSLVWNFCAHHSDVISWGNQWWGCKMSAVFPGEFLARSNGGLEGRLGMKLLCFKLTNSKKAKKSCFQLMYVLFIYFLPPGPYLPLPPPPISLPILRYQSLKRASFKLKNMASIMCIFPFATSSFVSVYTASSLPIFVKMMT